MMNQMAWSQDPLLSKWLLRSRLDGFGKVIAAIDKNDAEKMAVVSRLRGNAMAAAGNLQKLSGF